MSKNSKRKRQSLGQTMGGVIVGFDQQVFRTTPPPHELVLKGSPVRGLSGEDAGDLDLLFPDEVTIGAVAPSAGGPGGDGPAHDAAAPDGTADGTGGRG